ncbi:MAG: sigma 54-interacting transcriptional regulator, partial [Gemmatimonadales bacterium]|nr:sigma 54-interacting transcriptional regulator [Gemmatimonadales bacterium]
VERAGRFELADGGTLFLDEIANITLQQQARLLRALQTGEIERVGSSQTRRVDVRFIAATNADLRTEVAEGRFREDLLFRLNTIEVRLPPLRERADDILLLAQYFLIKTCAQYRKTIAGFSPAAVALLKRYEWPGNVRELAHAVERAVLLAGGTQIEAEDLALGAGGGTPPAEPRTLDDLERETVRRALARCDGNVSLAAKELGLSRSALYRRIEKFGL